MMNNSTVNKNHIPCQTWAGQNGWSTTSSEELLINQHTSSHHLGLGSSSEQRNLYNFSQASNQSCINDLNTLTSRNDNPHTALYNDPRMSSITLSSLLFHNTADTSAPHLNSFAQQIPHTSSMMLATNQEKSIPPPSLSQQNHGPQTCSTQDLPYIAPNSPLKALLQSPMSSQCLPNRLQDHPIGLQSCELQINTTQASFGGQNMESIGITGFAQSTSQQQSQWVPSSHSGGAVEKAVSGGAVCLKKERQRQEIDQNIPKKPSLVNMDKSRSAILQKRALLLEQLERMDELLQSLPPEDSDDEVVPETPDMKQIDTSEGYQIQLPSKEENESGSDAEEETDHEDDPDYMPHSEGSYSDCPSDDPNESDHLEGPSSPAKKKKAPLKEEVNESESLSITPPKKKHKTSQKDLKILKAFVLSSSTMKAGCEYDVKNYCLFCSKPMSKLSRHLERIHSDKPEVAIAFQYPLHSKERQKIWKKLRIEGNFAHNRDVMRTGQGQLAVRAKPRIPTNVIDFVHCIYCRSLFKKKSLYAHMSKCPEKTKAKDHLPMGREKISQSVLLTVGWDELGISESLRNILGGMNYDDVTRAVMGDTILMQYGEQMCEDYGHDSKKCQYIRQNLRQIARLLLKAQKTTPMQKMEDFFHPSNFQHVVSAVNVLAGYDADKKAFRIPSLAVKLGYCLQKTCCIVEDNAMESGDTEVAESARNFLSLYQQKWSKLISLDALKNLKETKRNKKQVPFAQFAEDMKLLHTHMENVHHDVEKKLREDLNKENYGALARVILTRLIVFNRRQTSEVATMTVTAFASRKKSTVLDEMDVSVSNMEKTLCGFFTRVDIRGSSDRIVPILLKPCLESSMELLVSVRKECGILSDNPFIFARPSALSAYRGTDCLRIFVKECGANNPTAITPMNMRKHFTRMLPLINLNEDEAKQIFGPKHQIQQQNDDDDEDMESEEEEAATGHRRAVSRTSYGLTGLNHRETQGEPNSCKKAAPPRPGIKRRGPVQQGKHKWDEAEVSAVEKHLIHFIKKHRVPQKDDCVQCLEAEPDALKARSWKGVKDYVRNRITILQRQNDSSRDLSRSEKGSRQNKPQQDDERLQPSEGHEAASGSRCEAYSASGEPADLYHQQAHEEISSSDGTTPHEYMKSKEMGPLQQGKHKWDEAEVSAVEKHLIHFIKKHKVPQKDDCVQCLEAEPDALKARSWKGVKDYVRNRITILQRQNDSSRDLSRSEKGSRQNKPQQDDERLQPSEGHEAASGSRCEAYSASDEPADLYHQQAHEEISSSDGTTPHEYMKSKEMGPLQQGKHKWDEAEVSAVEKHLIHFIKKHKVPQKDDCVQCLEAEPDALKARSWKGVKDYVRNRITTLQRQNDSSRDLSRSEKGSRQNKPQQDDGNFQQNVKERLQPSEGHEAASGSRCEAYSASGEPADLYHQQAHEEISSSDGTTPHEYMKSKEMANTGVPHKSKHKWDEAEVRAVEKHMMHFIEEQRVPQKNDCDQCLDAEPNALKARSWKGVKDYVRNRITTLQRQNDYFKKSSKKRNRSRQEEKFLQNFRSYHQL